MRGNALLAAIALVAISVAACSMGPEFDILVSGGTLVDGTGAPPRLADIGIKGDRIVAIGTLTDRTAAVRIDAMGKSVTPGFIDIMGRSGVSLLSNGLAESHLRQGITTEMLVDGGPAFWTSSIANHDALRVAGVAFDWSGFDGYFGKLASRGIAINIGTIAPLSLATNGTAAFIDAAMRDGAWGVVDDGRLAGADSGAVAAAVGRSNGVLVLPADSPIVASDTSFSAVADMAHRVVIADLGRVTPGPATAALNERIARATQRNVAVYGTVVPPSEQPTNTSISEALRFGGVMVATNSEGTSLRHSNATAAAFGAFPRLLGPMVRDERLMELKEAIRRSTSLPAAVFNIPQRGIVRENYFADIVVFDAARIADRSTPEKPNQNPSGIDYVLVNGVVTVTPRGITGARPGYGLLRNHSQR
jgi:N-acyl-D-aspartate/D-glutamate deacylase